MCSKVTENGIVRHRSQAFWPRCLRKVESRTPARSTGPLWLPCCGMLDNLPAALLQLPSCNGDFTSMSHRGTDTEQQREPQVLFGLYRMIFLWGCTYRWNQPGFVPVMSSKEKNLQLFLKQHPSAAFTGGQFSQVFEDERGKVSSPRSPAGIQPEETDYFFFPMPEMQAQ